jgi:hypothetical protein
MPTLTEDAFRRRELAALGVQAEVDTDGHNAVVRLDIHALDKLIASIESDDVRERRHDAAFDAGHADGYLEGHTDGNLDGRREVLAEFAQLADLTPEQLAELTQGKAS